MRKTLIIGLLGAFSLSVEAEQIAITNGTAYVTGDKKVEQATVLIKDGKIESVKKNGKIPKGYRVIDASNKWVTSGLMVANSTLGLSEVSLSAGIVDSSLNNSQKKTVALDVSYAINPDSTLIPVTRIDGITRAVTSFSRTSTPWMGQGAVIHLGNGADLIVKNPAFVQLDVTGGKAGQTSGSRAALWASVYTKLDGAKPKKESGKKSAKKSGKKKNNKGDSDKPTKPDAEKEALARLFSGEAALMVEATRAADIRQVIKLKKTYPEIRFILSGANEAWRVAKDLAANDIAVVLYVMANLPESFETLGSTQANAARLHAAGVKIAFVGDGSHRAKLVAQHAGNAVANGLPWAAAFDALTINPAEMFGIEDSYGSLTRGKDADVVVWTGDPIEITTHADHVIIQGEEIELISRQTKLRDRYMALPRSPAIGK